MESTSSHFDHVDYHDDSSSKLEFEHKKSQKPVIDPVARQITASLSSEQARDILASPIKKSAYAIAYSDLRSKGLEVNAGDLYSNINKAYLKIADKGWLGKVGEAISSFSSAFMGAAHADPAPAKLDTESLKLAHSIADKAVGGLASRDQAAKDFRQIKQVLQSLGEKINSFQAEAKKYFPNPENIQKASLIVHNVNPEDTNQYIKESKEINSKASKAMEPLIKPAGKAVKATFEAIASIERAVHIINAYPGYDQEGITDIKLLSKTYDTPIFDTPEQQKAINYIKSVITITAFGGKFVYDKIKYGEFLGARHIVGGEFDIKYKTVDFNNRLKTKDFVGISFEKPPYGYKSYVLEYHTTETVKNDFIRLYNTDPLKGLTSKPDGAFIMLKKDFAKDIRDGLSLSDIADKYGLPNIPNKIVIPEIPANVRMGVGMAGEISFEMGDNSVLKRLGGGRQYQILQFPDPLWFPESKAVSINEYINRIKK